MTKLKKLLRVLKDRSGATTIEYCIIAGIVSVAVVGGATVMGTKTNDTFADVNARVWGS